MACNTCDNWIMHPKIKEITCLDCKTARKKLTEKLYTLKHAEKRRAIAKQWALDNPDKIRARNRRYKARKLACKTSVYTEKEVLDLHGFNCHICLEPIDANAPRTTRLKGWEKGLQIDHVVALSQGGSDTLQNVRPAHGLCNLNKGGK